jgi:hypothetical protein
VTVKHQCHQAERPIQARPAEPLAEVLRDVADFRVALESDLLIAAAAADLDEPELAAGIVTGERSRLESFHAQVLRRLAGLRGVG